MKAENIKIILVNTTHPGNIGAVARAMKTMGLTELVLVKPKSFPHPEAQAMSSHADDILERAIVTETLAEAINDCWLVIGASARLRALAIETGDPRQIAPQVGAASEQGCVAIVFGRESSGLTNEEIDLCHGLVHIPSNENYGSLNVAQAVQIICYELRLHWLASKSLPTISDEVDPEYATSHETEGFYEHLEKTLWDIAFIRPHNPKEVMRKLRRLYSRAHLTKEEINILRGILTAVQYDREKQQ